MEKLLQHWLLIDDLGTIKVAAVKAPVLEIEERDVAGHCNSYRRRCCIRKRGFTLENTTPDMLGSAEKVTIDKENTTIVNGAGKKNDIA